MGLRLFFLPNFPVATFIPDSRVCKLTLLMMDGLGWPQQNPDFCVGRSYYWFSQEMQFFKDSNNCYKLQSWNGQFFYEYYRNISYGVSSFNSNAKTCWFVCLFQGLGVVCGLWNPHSLCQTSVPVSVVIASLHAYRKHVRSWDQGKVVGVRKQSLC